MLIAVSELESLGRRTCLTPEQPQMHAAEALRKACGFLALVGGHSNLTRSHARPVRSFSCIKARYKHKCIYPFGLSDGCTFLNCLSVYAFLGQWSRARLLNEKSSTHPGPRQAVCRPNDAASFQLLPTLHSTSSS